MAFGLTLILLILLHYFATFIRTHSPCQCIIFWFEWPEPGRCLFGSFPLFLFVPLSVVRWLVGCCCFFLFLFLLIFFVVVVAVVVFLLRELGSHNVLYAVTFIFIVLWLTAYNLRLYFFGDLGNFWCPHTMLFCVEWRRPAWCAVLTIRSANNEANKQKKNNDKTEIIHTTDDDQRYVNVYDYDAFSWPYEIFTYEPTS